MKLKLKLNLRTSFLSKSIAITLAAYVPPFFVVQFSQAYRKCKDFYNSLKTEFYIKTWN